jgi:hypothetical protein
MKQITLNLEASKKIKEFLKKDCPESCFYWRLSYHVTESFEFGTGKSIKKEGIFGEYELQLLPYPRYTTADIKWNDSDLGKIDETEIPAFTFTELIKEVLPLITARKGYKFYESMVILICILSRSSMEEVSNQIINWIK